MVDEGKVEGPAHVIAGEFNIYNVAEQAGALLAMVADTDEPALDLGGVVEFDSAALQLFMAAEAEARERGRSLRLVAASPVVAELLGFAGLGDRLPGTARP